MQIIVGKIAESPSICILKVYSDVESKVHNMLQAAKTLQDKSNIKVTLLEASMSLGGRARSTMARRLQLDLANSCSLLPRCCWRQETGLLQPHKKEANITCTKLYPSSLTAVPSQSSVDII